MKRTGIRLTFIGLTAGILIGLVILYAQNQIGHLVIDALREEVEKSCENCTFEVERVQISLPFLSGAAKNVRILSAGKEALRFETIRAHFDISQIREKKILLSDLHLLNGFADGVSEKSPTYQFIDHLTKPLPPEKDIPGRWRIILEKLRISQSGFIERFGESALIGERVSMDMKKNQHDNFHLRPRIGTLRYESRQRGSITQLGTTTGDLIIKDNIIDFQSVLLQQKKSMWKLKGTSSTKEGNRITADHQFKLFPGSFELPGWLQGQVQGSGQASGTLGSPILNGEILPSENTDLQVQFGNFQPLKIDNLRGDLFIDFRDGDPLVEIKNIYGSGNGQKLHSTTSFQYEKDQLSGSFQIQTDSLQYGSIRARGVNAKVNISGPLHDLSCVLEGTIQRPEAFSASLPPLIFSVIANTEKASLKFSHQKSDSGTFEGTLELKPENKGTLIQNAKFHYQNFAIDPSGLDYAGPFIRLSGSGVLHQASFATPPSGDFSLTISPSRLPGESDLSGSVRFTDGIVHSNFTNKDNSLSATLQIKNQSTPGILKIQLQDFHLNELLPSLQCVQGTADLHYQFQPEAFRSGSGEIGISALSIGCTPYTLSLMKPTNIGIQKGKLIISATQFEGEGSSLELQGVIDQHQGYNIHTDGTVQLTALLPFLPDIDDISGTVEGTASLTGMFSDPNLSGSFQVSQGAFAVEAASLSGDRINGALSLEGEKIQIENLNGFINGGEVFFSGTIFPLSMEQSVFDLQFKNFVFEPTENGFIETSGQLFYKGRAHEEADITGKIDILHGEFEEELDLRTVVQLLAKLLLSTDKQQTRTGSLPDLSMAIEISIPRNLFLISNWASTELRGNLLINGTLNKMQLNGKLEALRGWFGLQDRIFTITSGTVHFSPEHLRPKLDLTGETSLFTRLGESVVIFVEAHGPISSPRIQFLSNQGLSQQEILELLSSGLSISAEQRELRPGYEQNTLPTFADIFRPGQWGNVLKDLTRIDTLGLEPAFNTRRGTLEPSIVARKNLSRVMALSGQSFLVGSNPEATLTLEYLLHPELRLSGTLDTISTEQATVFGIDLVHTVLSREKTRLEIQIKGNRDISTTEILSSLRIGRTTRLPIEEVVRVRDSIQQLYHNRGYTDAIVNASCVSGERLCHQLEILIEEGVQYSISRFVFDPLPPEDLKLPENLLRLSSQQIATEEFLKKYENTLTLFLRNSGYISARVRCSYEPDEKKKKVLHSVIFPGDRITLRFEGNTVFDVQTFLELIHLNTRKQPFGKNTVNILVERIERLYRQNGYLFVSLSVKDSLIADKVREYVITIREESTIPVREVRIKGNTSLDIEYLKTKIQKSDPTRFEEIFAPRFAVAEALEYNKATLASLYRKEGYPQVFIEYRILPTTESQEVDIEYQIEEGEELKAHFIEFIGIPEKTTPMSSIKPPYSIPKANQIIDTTVQYMRSAGFLQALVTSHFDTNRGVLTITVHRGPPTRIGQIIIDHEGHIGIDDIRQHLTITSGEQWDEKNIRETRSALLRLGLFSRITIGPFDGSLDSPEEDLVIRLEERALRTLELGTGLNSEFGIRIFAEAVDRALFQDGKTLSFRVDAYYDPNEQEISRGFAGFRFFNPDLLDSSFRFTQDLRFQKIDLSTLPFDLDRLSLASNIYKSWQNGITFSIGHTLSRDNMENVLPGAQIGEFDSGTVDLSFLQTSLAYDQRDNPINPQKGFNIEFDYRAAWEGIGSEANFHSAGAEASGILPFGKFAPEFSFAAKSRVVSSWAFSNTDQIPITQRFFSGGRDSIRGFRENSLGPQTADGTVIGGDLLVANNFELRYLFNEIFSSHLFYDLGTVYLKDQSTRASDLRHSTGVGFRYLSPIGPISFDVGHPLDEKDGEPSIRFHFSIGSRF